MVCASGKYCLVAGSLEVSFRSMDKDFVSRFQVPPQYSRRSLISHRRILCRIVSLCHKKNLSRLLSHRLLPLQTNLSRQPIRPMKHMEQSLFSQPPNFDSRVWPGFEKFNYVQRILDHNRLLIHVINQNHEAHNSDALYRNVALIRELNSNMTKVRKKIDVNV